MPTRDQLMAILRIGHRVSLRGDRESLADALERTDYGVLRPAISEDDLLPLIDAAIALEWVRFSEDKRTNGGWYLTEQGCVGRPGAEEDAFGDLARATAVYVLRELDHWRDVAAESAARTARSEDASS